MIIIIHKFNIIYSILEFNYYLILNLNHFYNSILKSFYCAELNYAISFSSLTTSLIGLTSTLLSGDNFWVYIRKNLAEFDYLNS